MRPLQKSINLQTIYNQGKNGFNTVAEYCKSLTDDNLTEIVKDLEKQYEKSNKNDDLRSFKESVCRLIEFIAPLKIDTKITKIWWDNILLVGTKYDFYAARAFIKHYANKTSCEINIHDLQLSQKDPKFLNSDDLKNIIQELLTSSTNTIMTIGKDPRFSSPCDRGMPLEFIRILTEQKKLVDKQYKMKEFKIFDIPITEEKDLDNESLKTVIDFIKAFNCGICIDRGNKILGSTQENVIKFLYQDSNRINTNRLDTGNINVKIEFIKLPLESCNLPNLSSYQQLKTLKISDSKMDSKGVELFATHAEKLTHLEEFILDKITLSKDHIITFFKNFEKMPNLKKLTLTNSYLTEDDTLNLIASLKGHKNLIEINLENEDQEKNPFNNISPKLADAIKTSGIKLITFKITTVFKKYALKKGESHMKNFYGNIKSYDEIQPYLDSNKNYWLVSDIYQKYKVEFTDSADYTKIISQFAKSWFDNNQINNVNKNTFPFLFDIEERFTNLAKDLKEIKIKQVSNDLLTAVYEEYISLLINYLPKKISDEKFLLLAAQIANKGLIYKPYGGESLCGLANKYLMNIYMDKKCFSFAEKAANNAEKYLQITDKSLVNEVLEKKEQAKQQERDKLSNQVSIQNPGISTISQNIRTTVNSQFNQNTNPYASDIDTDFDRKFLDN